MNDIQEMNKLIIENNRKPILLFPSSFFKTSVVDEDLRNEWKAAQGTGLFDMYLFSYDAWFNHKTLILDRVPEKKTRSVYRGWMMLSEDYTCFYEKLLAKWQIRFNSYSESGLIQSV